MQQDMIFGKYLTLLANDVPVRVRVDPTITIDYDLPIKFSLTLT